MILTIKSKNVSWAILERWYQSPGQPHNHWHWQDEGIWWPDRPNWDYSPDAKNWLIGKDPDAGKDWRREKKGTTEDEMVGWHTNSMGRSLSKFWEMVKDREAWYIAVHGVSKSQTQLTDWTTTRYNYKEGTWGEFGGKILTKQTMLNIRINTVAHKIKKTTKQGFSGGWVVKILPANVGDSSLIPCLCSRKISHDLGQLSQCTTTTEPVL